MNEILNKARNEPVLVRTLVGAVLVLLVQLKVPISSDLADAVTALIVATLAFTARAKVTPVNRK